MPIPKVVEEDMGENVSATSTPDSKAVHLTSDDDEVMTLPHPLARIELPRFWALRKQCDDTGARPMQTSSRLAFSPTGRHRKDDVLYQGDHDPMELDDAPKLGGRSGLDDAGVLGAYEGSYGFLENEEELEKIHAQFAGHVAYKPRGAP